MAFHFQADLSPCPTDAGVSRFLITTVPSNFYVSGENLEYVRFTSQYKKIELNENIENIECYQLPRVLLFPAFWGQHISRSSMEQRMWPCKQWRRSSCNLSMSCQTMACLFLVLLMAQSLDWKFQQTLFDFFATLGACVFSGLKIILLLHELQGWLEIPETALPLHQRRIKRKGSGNWGLGHDEHSVMISSRHCCADAIFLVLKKKCRHAWQVCWMCESTKGTNNLDYAYTNICPTAAWRRTLYSADPWPANEPPQFTKLRGFDVRMISIDMLHCFHLGIGRVIGSAVKLLVTVRYWPGPSIEKYFRELQCDCKTLQKIIVWHYHANTWPKISWDGASFTLS